MSTDAESAVALRQKRYAARKLVSGKFVTTAKGVRHGTNEAFVEYGCRCDPCEKRGVQVAELARRPAR